MQSAQEQELATALQQQVAGQSGSVRTTCPQCSSERRNKHVKCMSVKVEHDHLLYACHHCGIEGRIETKDRVVPISRAKPKPVPQQPKEIGDLDPSIQSLLESRGVSRETARATGCTIATRYFGDAGRELLAMGFPYRDNGKVTAIKWRSAEGKHFTQEGAAKTFFNLQNTPDQIEDLVIVEGEFDAVACAEAGVWAVSVPNGAPLKVSDNNRPDPSEDGKFAYVWHAKKLIDKAKRVVLAVDNDSAGQALKEELARRIGRARCYQIEHPDDCKDANDILLKHGAEKLREVLANPEPMPLSGVYSGDHYAEQVRILHAKGAMKGASTGFKSLDRIYTVPAGQLTVVTGLPGSGKSELLDQIAINLARDHGWKFCVCSFENPVPLHISKLAEKYVGTNFFEWSDGAGSPTPPMSEEQMEGALQFIGEHFMFQDQHDDSGSTIDDILSRAKDAVMRLGIRGLIVDPYNYINRNTEDRETDYVSAMLTKVLNFAKSYDVHVWMVAHPQKMAPMAGRSAPQPDGNTISGSAAWFAKTDFGLTVDQGSVRNWKTRFKWFGRPGTAHLDYDPRTGRYTDGSPPPPTSFNPRDDDRDERPRWF